MKDYLFFPLAFLLALGIIAAAALPGRGRLACGSVSGAGTDYRTVTVSGDNLCRMNAAGQAKIERIKSGEQISSLIISADVGTLGDRPERNPHFRLAVDLEHAFANSNIRVKIVARPSRESGASAFEANYSAGAEGDSGWQTIRLTSPEYTEYSFTWQVPPRVGENQAVDYLAIRPVIPSKSRSIEIKSVVFENLGKVQP